MKNSLPLGLSPEWALVVVSALWGSTFIILSVSLESISPALLVAIRFGFGALLTALFLGKDLLGLTKTDWIAGFFTGTFIFLGYFLQTVGLQTIPSSISAFLTALYVPFVPIFQWLFFRKRPDLIVGSGIAVAFLGMVLIMDPTRLSFAGSFGEWLTVASAAACALEIIVIAIYAGRCNPTAFCFTQLVTVAGYASLYCVAVEDIVFKPNLVLFACLAVLAAIVAFNQFAISWAQKTVSPIRAVLIYTLEPVFAGIIGWLVGEKIGLMAVIGGALVVASVIISSWLPKYLEQQKRLQTGAARV